jgi:hypothetical protein
MFSELDRLKAVSGMKKKVKMNWRMKAPPMAYRQILYDPYWMIGPACVFSQHLSFKYLWHRGTLTDGRSEVDATEDTEIEDCGVESTFVHEPVHASQLQGFFENTGQKTDQISAMDAGTSASIGAMQNPLFCC